VSNSRRIVTMVFYSHRWVNQVCQRLHTARDYSSGLALVFDASRGHAGCEV
jgi:hypothetical protein